MIKATIEPVKGKGLWLIVDREDKDSTVHPITNDEVEPIMKACEEWLEKQSESK